MLNEEKYFDYFNNINDFVWGRRIYKKDIEEWIKNFHPVDELNVRELAIRLLFGFIFYNKNEIDYLCKHAFGELKRNWMKGIIKNGVSIWDAEKRFEKFIENTKFFGKSGCSSGLFAYHFRQLNHLPESDFIQSIEDIKSTTRALVIVDDFLGSGETIITLHEMLIKENIFKKNPKLEVYYVILIAMQEGIKNITDKYPDCKIIYSELLTKNYKVFSDETNILVEYSATERKKAKRICKEIGKFLEGEEKALGYKDSEVLVGFSHNTPNNTLPIIWSHEKHWYPLFPRKDKKY